MASQPLINHSNHLYVPINGQNWLLDTGAPASFGDDALVLGGEAFEVGSNYLGLTAREISGYVHYPVTGLIGADILNRFDVMIDVAGGLVTFSTDPLELGGQILPLGSLMGVPVVDARLGGQTGRFFFDTGAQICYGTGFNAAAWPGEGTLQDFYPGLGSFEVEVRRVNVELGTLSLGLRCAELPGMLGMTLGMVGVEGILGNEILQERTIGYFPRRQQLVLT